MIGPIRGADCLTARPRFSNLGRAARARAFRPNRGAQRRFRTVSLSLPPIPPCV
ncbi:chromosome segregation SMC domain protein [Burkholderia pseudomallei]|nr:chromosome segregation protein SMC [Burkholderia pseudomallei]KGD27382.1 chromosome segregation protein SMC [Burkholderia pseudomallei]KGD44708.1 chromosome segregation protein SMC [Burkholderia pseudomallei]KGD58637.1 chromosome segregation SMC domain protein [Burkholderia pseudomallei]